MIDDRADGAHRKSQSGSESTPSLPARLAARFRDRDRHIVYGRGWYERKRDLTADDITDHLEGRATVGAFTGGDGWSDFGQIDADLHVPEPTAEQIAANERYVLAKSGELGRLGIVHLLFRNNDRGSYHVHIPTERIDSARLARCLAALAADGVSRGLTLETFPLATGTNKGVRLPGRHHKFPDCSSEVWVDGAWHGGDRPARELADLGRNPADKFPDPGPSEEPKQAAGPKAEPRAAEPDKGALSGEQPGDHYGRVTDIHRLLLDSGFAVHSRSGDRVYYTRPGKKAADGLSGSVLGNSFWLFTNAVDGLRPSAENGKKPYGPFGLYAYLSHGGDFRAAASELRAAGYGWRSPGPGWSFGSNGGAPKSPPGDATAGGSSDGTGTGTGTGPEPLPRVRYADIGAILDDLYLIKQTLPRVGLSVIFGPPGSGKTFFALDLALWIAAGHSWRGRRVKGGAVLYVAAEAGRGMLNRVEAFKRVTGLPDLPFDVVPCSVNLLDPNADVDRVITAALAAAAELGVPVVLVVIDTLSRAFGGGDENGSEDMGAFVRNADKIRDALGGQVAVVHHSGKDAARGARGHSSLHAAADTVIEVSADEATRIHTARVVKQRDGETGTVYPFRLRVVELGVDVDGDPVTSCVVDADADAPATDPRANLTADQRSALNLLAGLVASEGREESTVPVGRRVVTLDKWREAFHSRAKPGATPRTRQQAFHRASSKLIAADLVCCINPFVWPSE